MKVVILAGGLGTRISEESHIKPKPMIEIGEKPILWHIMKIYSYYGFNDFIICLGYKGYIIKEYFANYFLHESDITFKLNNKDERIIHNNSAEPWSVTLVNTGIETMTGGRLKRVQKYIGNETFMLTYGDGVADVDIIELLNFHKRNKKLVTVTAIQPEGRFGSLAINYDNEVTNFIEKPKGDGNWVNAGFFVMEPEIFNFILNDNSILEKEFLEKISLMNELVAYKHQGFWQPMDTLRDKNKLEDLLSTGVAPWIKWS